MVNRAMLTVALLPALLGGASCFDVQSVDPGPDVIDDFDKGSVYPLDSNFGGWQCYSFNPNTNTNYSCALSQDTLDDNGYSLKLEFSVNDPLDGTQEHGGAALATYATSPEDFTRFSQIVFDAELQPGTPAIPSDALLYLQLQCSTAQLEGGPGRATSICSREFRTPPIGRRLILDDQLRASSLGIVGDRRRNAGLPRPRRRHPVRCGRATPGRPVRPRNRNVDDIYFQ